MASGMTKTQLVRHMAEKLETNNKTAATFLETSGGNRNQRNQEERRIRHSWPGPLGKIQPESPHGTQSSDR